MNMTIRKIMIISGTRSEYGLLKPIMNAIEKEKRLELAVVVTGSHLEEQYGKTVNEIRNDGFKILAEVKLALGNKNKDMANVLAQCITSLTSIITENNPDIVVVLGDRVETLGAALTAYYLNIPIAHIHGGDKSLGGHLDDSVRHAITKLAHIHFAATEKSADRIKRLGEEKWRIYVVGAPGLDSILNEKFVSKKELYDRLHLDHKTKKLVIVQHPITTEAAQAAQQIRETLYGANGKGFQIVIIYPNADAGSIDIIKEIDTFAKNRDVKVFKNISHNDYITLLRYAEVLVGNSSSGIIEAPLLRLPFVNVGTRQLGRERANNVIDVGYDRKDIAKAIKEASSSEFRKRLVGKNPYGEGNAGKRIAQVLAEIETSKRLIQKQITY